MLFTRPMTEAEDGVRAVTEVAQAADIAAVVLRLAPADERSLINRVKAIAPALQAHGAAVLLDGEPEIVARGGADGAHLTGIAAVQAAIECLHPDRIVGVGGLKTRHDAMLAGETGADYVMFGEPNAAGRRPAFAAIVERVAWWAEIFEPPCVGFAGSLDEIASLAAAGADFVALGEWLWTAASDPAAVVAAAARRLVGSEQMA